MTECLIIPCSERKKVYDKPMPAIEVFDGVLARVVRKQNPGLAVFIVSGKYGLVSRNDLVEAYEIPGGIGTILNREYVIEKVVKKWLEHTDGVPDKFDTIWHITRGAAYQAIEVLGKWATLRHVLPDDMEMRHNIGVMLRELKAFCITRPTYGNIDLDHLVAMYKQAQAEGKV